MSSIDMPGRHRLVSVRSSVCGTCVYDMRVTKSAPIQERVMTQLQLLPRAQPVARTYALLSVGAALLTIILKSTAYLLTGSVGLLSDALESLVNLVAALVAVWALTLATRPADADHGYGHSKAEYIASAVEGILILVAAVSIGWAAVDRLFHLRALEQVWLGLAISV